MLSGVMFNPAVSRLTAFWKSNEAFLNSAANKIASGKALLSPADDISNYFRSNKIRHDNDVYQMFQRDIVAAQSLLDVTDKAGAFVFERLTKMQGLVTDYQNPANDALTKAGIKAEFDALAGAVTEYINAARYNDRQIVADTGTTSLASVNLDPNDISQTLDISFGAGDVANPATLDIDDVNIVTALQAEVDKAGSYLAKVAAYKVGLRAHSSIMDTTRTSSGAIEDSLDKVDDAAAMMTYSRQMTQQQMAMSALGRIFSGQEALLNLLG